ncbi:MAG: hypothetical protein H7Y38_07890 [Armatimonadetes bacterium]|nr:hypothetical protein [Armatimonadota bacterium]
MENKTCAKCGSNHLMPGLEIISHLYKPTVMTGSNWIGMATASSELTATVCGECGYTEIYATEPQTLYKEWRRENA